MDTSDPWASPAPVAAVFDGVDIEVVVHGDAFALHPWNAIELRDALNDAIDEHDKEMGRTYGPNGIHPPAAYGH